MPSTPPASTPGLQPGERAARCARLTTTLPSLARRLRRVVMALQVLFTSRSRAIRATTTTESTCLAGLGPPYLVSGGWTRGGTIGGAQRVARRRETGVPRFPVARGQGQVMRRLRRIPPSPSRAAVSSLASGTPFPGSGSAGAKTPRPNPTQRSRAPTRRPPHRSLKQGFGVLEASDGQATLVTYRLHGYDSFLHRYPNFPKYTCILEL